MYKAVTCMITSPIIKEVKRFGVNFHNCHGNYIIWSHFLWPSLVAVRSNELRFLLVLWNKSVEVVQDLCRVGMYTGRPHILWTDNLVMDKYSIQNPFFLFLPWTTFMDELEVSLFSSTPSRRIMPSLKILPSNFPFFLFLHCCCADPKVGIL